MFTERLVTSLELREIIDSVKSIVNVKSYAIFLFKT